MKKTSRFILLFILLVITESAWAFTLKFNITGISNEAALQNASNRLNVVAQNNGAPLTFNDIQNFHLTAPNNILHALQPYGYYQAQINGQLLHQGNSYTANYQVIPGPLMHITAISVNVIGPGASSPALLNSVYTFPLKKGLILNTEQYTSAKQALFDTALQQGYLTAYFTQQQIQIDLAHYTAVITLQLATGPRYYFGPVQYNQNPFATSFLQRFVPFSTGEPYSTDKLLDLQNALSNSNYFTQVSVQGAREQAQNYYIPVTVNLTPRKEHQYTLSAGYGTDTGPRVGLGYDWRRANSTGDYLTTQLSISQIQNSLAARYVIPGKNPLTDQYNITASMFTTSLEQGYSRTYQAGVNQTKTMGNWQQTIALNYQVERFQFSGQPYQNSDLLLPTISWVYLSKNDPIYPTQGNRFSFSLQGSAKALFSTSTFIQSELQDKYIFSPTDASRILLRTDLGYSVINDLNTFPLSLRFYAGGTQSVRGYAYQALGVPDGGRFLAVGSVEYQHQIIGKWNGALFYDIGNAFNNTDQGLDRGVGAGLLWVSPIGPLEITLGKALDLPGKPFKVQFTMGPDL